MTSQAVFAATTARFQAGLKTRVLAFGSSNTERFLSGPHWFDVFDLAVKQTYGRVHHCVDTGIGGNTTRDLLGRFEEDAAFYRPHLAIITVGGNDSMNPDKGVPAKEFGENLRELRRRFGEMGCAVVFQTYYSPDPLRISGLEAFYNHMDVVRSVAKETNSGLVDHLARWEPLRTKFPERYFSLMHDGFHLNWKGNIALGLDLARAFGLSCGNDDPEYWREGLETQRMMDELEGKV